MNTHMYSFLPILEESDFFSGSGIYTWLSRVSLNVTGFVKRCRPKILVFGIEL